MNALAFPPAYLARAACGCVKLIIVDLPEHAEQNAQSRAFAERAGYRLEVAPSTWLGANLPVECPRCALPRKVRPPEDGDL